MPFTENRGLFYPAATDLRNATHTHIKNLAEDVDAALQDTEWIALPLSNGWAQYTGSSRSLPRYRRHQGLVHIYGVIQKASAAAGDTICTLPPGFRITGPQQIFASIASGGQARVDINSEGRVIYQSGGGTWFSLDSIPPFIADA